MLGPVAAVWGIEARSRLGPRLSISATVKDLVAAARVGNAAALKHLDLATTAVAEAIRQMITLLCPRRIVIGGGVSLIGEELFFAPLRRRVAEGAFEAFAGLTDIVPAALGEEVVVHGALALARRTFRGSPGERG